MNNLENIKKNLYKLEYNQEKTLEMIGVEKCKGVAYAFLTETHAVDYFEFMDDKGVFKKQINITDLQGVGINDEETLKAFSDSITNNLGYKVADPSEKMVLGQKIGAFVNLLGA